MNDLTQLPSTSLAGFRLAVAGGGALGLSIAALAGLRGARVTVFEPCAIGDNASGVAAGMLSPAFEAALEDTGDYPLYSRAYAAWPSFAEALHLQPAPNLTAGGLYLADEAKLDGLATRLANFGVSFARLGMRDAKALQPGLRDGSGGALHVADDARLDPQRTLRAMAQRLRDYNGRIVPSLCPGPPAPGFDATVLATGYGLRRWADLAPELGVLAPIKGHVLHFQSGPRSGPTIRSDGGYAAPQASGAVFGATMEVDRADLDLDQAIIARLHAFAAALLPELAAASFTARAGVRASTPDGRPLVGRSAGGLHLAVGARRNGWLLAPLIAAATLEGLQGGAAWPEFNPAR